MFPLTAWSEDQTLDTEPANCLTGFQMLIFCGYLQLTQKTAESHLQQKRIEELKKQVLDPTKICLRKRQIDNALFFRIAEGTHMFNITLQAVFCV